MTYEEICREVAKIKARYHEDDPYRLCRTMGIKLIDSPFGLDPDAIKGFFLEQYRIKTITVNADLPAVIHRIITSHEIGHAVLHCNTGIHAFHDVTLFDESAAFEKDANFFAAEYLLDDEAVFEVLNADATFFTAAAMLKVPMELLDFKFRLMKWCGYKLVEPPIRSDSCFLKRLEVPANADFYS